MALEARDGAAVAPALLTVDEAAEYLGISRRTLQRAVAASMISYVRAPRGHRRYRQEDLDEYLDRLPGWTVVAAQNTAGVA